MKRPSRKRVAAGRKGVSTKRPSSGAQGRTHAASGRRRAANPRRRPGGAHDDRGATVAALEIKEIESLKAELDRLSKNASPPRWNADPEDVRRSVAKLVLTLVEFIRQVLERQAIRRMDAGTLTPQETESVGMALMRLEETVRDLGSQFGLAQEDLNLDLGPVGKLL